MNSQEYKAKFNDSVLDTMANNVGDAHYDRYYSQDTQFRMAMAYAAIGLLEGLKVSACWIYCCPMKDTEHVQWLGMLQDNPIDYTIVSEERLNTIVDILQKAIFTTNGELDFRAMSILKQHGYPILQMLSYHPDDIPEYYIPFIRGTITFFKPAKEVLPWTK